MMTTIPRPIRTFALTATAALLACGLSACSGSSNEPAPVDNQFTDQGDMQPATNMSAPMSEEPMPMPADNASASDVTANASAEVLPPPPAPAPDQQMLDDASATGMTARASRGGDAASNGAADPVESK